MVSLPDLSIQYGRRATHNLTLFCSFGTASHLSNDQFSFLEKYLAPVDCGFRIRIVANEPNRAGPAPQPRFYLRTRRLSDRDPMTEVTKILQQIEQGASRVLGRCGSSSRMIRRSSSNPALCNRSEVNGVVPVNSS